MFATRSPPMAMPGSRSSTPCVSKSKPKKLAEPAAPTACGQSAWRVSQVFVSASVTQVPADPVSTPSATVWPSISTSTMNRPVSGWTRHGTRVPRGFNTPGLATVS